MQIVINIDDNFYKRAMVYKGEQFPDNDDLLSALITAVNNGVPLPKGHGRLVDADEILNHAHIEEDEDGDIFVKKWYCIEKDVFDNALVLIDGKRRKNE